MTGTLDPIVRREGADVRSEPLATRMVIEEGIMGVVKGMWMRSFGVPVDANE